ncbi:hypothetical protein pipiens_007379 [Culex pipiens pipiens]|uniref:Uncharacterized protein n=1 Tax=Culex pipiens pipiens TaxID=38569 RepID=A0ABD1DLV0_CULPP
MLTHIPSVGCGPVSEMFETCVFPWKLFVKFLKNKTERRRGAVQDGELLRRPRSEFRPQKISFFFRKIASPAA